MNKDIIWYWFVNLDGIGRKTRNELLKIYDEPEEIYYEKESILREYGFLRESQINSIISKNEKELIEKYNNILDKGIKFIHFEHKSYPENLKNIPDPPHALYIRGNIKPDASPVKASVIGSRLCSDYGYNVAYKIGYELGANNISVVSGMARGIDGSAQKGCISSGVPTYAVLGCGVDICYPKDNIELYMNIQKNGCLISEYHPGTKPYAGFFPERNRIISGLGDILIVVEAGKKSGTFITVEMALEQGRDVYAVPGRITDEKSRGCNHLIREGAYIYESINEIIEQLKSEKIIKYEHIKSENKNNSLESVSKKVYAILDFEPKHIDYIIEQTGLDMNEVLNTLYELEKRHIIRQSPSNYYVIDI